MPLDRIDNLSTFVRINISLTSLTLLSSTSNNPLLGGNPNSCGREGRATSASTSNTVRSNSIAMLIAKFTAENVFPSPGRELVTIIKLPFLIGGIRVALALPSSIRLMIRNSSATCDRGISGVVKPFAASLFKSNFI